VTLGGLVFRVTRFHALSGLIFDIVGPRSRPAAQRSEGRPEPPP